MQPSRHRWFDSLLAWYFVGVWGSGFIATKIGLQYAPPFTFLTLRYAFGLACLFPLVLVLRPAWPATRAEFAHILVAGVLMHAANLGGSHYAQYLGMSAGVTALILALQPLLTALVVSRWMHTRLAARQWLGVVLGLAGVTLVVWHKVDIRAVGWASLATVGISLAAITTGTLYQRVFCPKVDLYGAALLQFAISLAVVAPLAWIMEGMQVRWVWQLFAAIAFLVILASILAVNALHTLMRHGEATRVTSLLYLTPVIAVVLELLIFGVVPTPLSMVGIGVTCLGVAMVVWTKRRPAAIEAD
ncbi:MAG: EamA family transporter [Burkholderiales bacterium]|nr:EamA family transporter [Burkholderiales bacterium]